MCSSVGLRVVLARACSVTCPWWERVASVAGVRQQLRAKSHLIIDGAGSATSSTGALFHRCSWESLPFCKLGGGDIRGNWEPKKKHATQCKLARESGHRVDHHDGKRNV